MTELAHSVELAQQPAEIELLLVAVALLIGGTFLLWRSGVSWVSISALGFAVVSLVTAFVLPRGTVTPPVVPSSDPFLSISEPQPGAVLDAAHSVSVSVILENAPLSDGAELVLLVDGRKRMSSMDPSFQIRVRPGEHRLTVRYVPASKSDVRPIETSILVTAE